MPTPHYRAENFEAIGSLGYLIKRCGALMTLVAEDAFESQPLSFTQWIVLMKLRSSRSAHMSATALSAEMGHDMGALTRVVDSLEQAGFVKRERSLSDRRAVEIALTREGRQQVEKSLHLVVELLNELLEPFSKSEFDSLIAQLQRLLQRLQDHVDATPALQTPPQRTRKAPPRRRSAKAQRGGT